MGTLKCSGNNIVVNYKPLSYLRKGCNLASSRGKAALFATGVELVTAIAAHYAYSMVVLWS